MKKVSLFSFIIIIIMNTLSLDINAEMININPIKAGVLLYKEDYYYI